MTARSSFARYGPPPRLERVDRVERVQVEADDAGRRIGEVRREPLEQRVRAVEAAGPDEPRRRTAGSSSGTAACRATPIRALIDEQLRAARRRPGTPMSTGSAKPSARRAAIQRRDRRRVEAELGRHVARRTAALSRSACSERARPGCPGGPAGSTGSRSPRADARARPSPGAATGRRGTRRAPSASPPTTNARSTPAPASRASSSARCARSRIIRADRCGIARKPSAWSSLARSTRRLDPLGRRRRDRDRARRRGRSADLVGERSSAAASSKSGRRGRRASAVARGAASSAARRPAEQQPRASDVRVGHRRPCAAR